MADCPSTSGSKDSKRSPQNTPLCRPIFDAFLLNKPPVFVFLRFGPLCNASRSFAFTNAYCDIEGIKSQSLGVPGRTVAIDMDKLFARGFEVLQLRDKNKLSKEEKAALADLENFLQNIDIHQRNLVNAIEKMKTEQSKETLLSMAVAEHLFSKLASGYVYGIDERAQDKGPNKICRCGCKEPVNFTATGIGHHKVWHGFVDIMLSEKKEKDPVGTARIVTDNSLFDETEDEEPSAKRAKVADDATLTSQCGDSISEVKQKTKGLADQTFAQTVVFALAQKRLHPDSKFFIPNILITEKHFYIVMYDPSNDILIRSERFPLWSLESSSSLEILAVIALWMAIHYKLFCSGGDIFENLNDIKAEFMEHVIEDRQKFYGELNIGVVSFETEEKDELSRDLTLHMFDKVKLKKEIKV